MYSTVRQVHIDWLRNNKRKRNTDGLTIQTAKQMLINNNTLFPVPTRHYAQRRERRECKQRVNVYYHGRSLLFRIHDKGLGLALFPCYSSDAILSCRMRKNKSRLTPFFLFSFFLFNSRVSRMEAGTWREKSGRTVQARGWKQSGYDLYLLCQAARVGEQTKPACPFFFLFLLFSNLRHERYASMCNLKDRVALTFPMRQGKFD